MTPSTDLSATDALEMIGCLAEEVHRWHQVGKVHLEIDSQTICLHPAKRQASLVLPASSTTCLGGDSPSAEQCPPQFLPARPVEVPRDLAAARRALTDAGVPVAPEQIDLYQLGALLWRLLSGEPMEAYLRDPRAKAKLTPDLLALIDGALGQEAESRFANAGAFAAAATKLLQQRRELPFSSLGHFVVLEKIGHGGMGDVFKAYEPALERLVAIKVLPRKLAEQPDLLQRFHGEAAAAARLDHPNIVQIYFIGADQGHTFFAMQFIQGETLADRLGSQGRLGVAETLEIIEHVLLGLRAAHEQGLVHRDIKPSNILLDARNRRALVADFGLVKYLQKPGELTKPGIVVGTLNYVSPEQAQAHAVDSRADLYAVGVTLFRMLGGQLPFQADNAALRVFQHAFVAPPPLSQVAPDVPEPLVHMVAKLLSKSPDDRYQTAQELLDEIRALRAANLTAPKACAPSNTPVLASGNHAVQETPTIAYAPSTRSGLPPPPAGRRARRWGFVFAAALIVAVVLWLPHVKEYLARWFEQPPPQSGPIAPGTPPRPAEPPGPGLPADRNAAEWLVHLRGRGRIECGGQQRELAAMEDLPAEPFKLVAINLFENKQVTDADLGALTSLPSLTELNLGRTAVGDAGVLALPELPGLKTLHLGRTLVSDAALAALHRFPTLATLNLDTTNVTNEGLNHLSKLPRLEQLMLANTLVGDEGLRHLSLTPALKLLGLNNTQVSDNGLAFIGILEGLTLLQLSDTKVTDTGLKSLHPLRKLSQVELRRTAVTPAGAEALKSELPNCAIIR